MQVREPDEFTHFNEQGRAKMVNVGHKEISERKATAYSQITMKHHVWERVKNLDMEKGDVLTVAQVAGIMAAKRTSETIPMCHPLFLSGVNITFDFPEKGKISIQVEVETKGTTGVEMEALNGASAAALTIYDMCKALDKGMVIGPTYLLEKIGGKSGEYRRELE